MSDIRVEDVFSPAEISQFGRQGYSYADIQAAVNNVSNNSYGMGDLNKTASNPQGFKNMSNTFFSGTNSDSLAKLQLEVDSTLERLEHLLRGDRIGFQNNNVIWEKTNDPTKIIFNEQGVAELMQVLAGYVNINTLMSNYSEEIINNKVYDVGVELNDSIYMRYKEFGLDNLNKRKAYPMIHRIITDIVHSTYLRALNGVERESLRKNMSVNENSNPNGMIPPNITGGNRERGILNPIRWFAGRFK